MILTGIIETNIIKQNDLHYKKKKIYMHNLSKTVLYITNTRNDCIFVQVRLTDKLYTSYENEYLINTCIYIYMMYKILVHFIRFLFLFFILFRQFSV